MPSSARVNGQYTDAYLLEYSEHVHYEIDMFFETVEVRSRPAFNEWTLSLLGHPQRMNNALIESFVVHLRNLIDFLYLPSKGTDVVAEDFVPAPGWAGIRPQISPVLATAKTRANKEISHLTTDRLSGAPPEKVWDFVGLAAEIRPLLVLFVQKADKARLASFVEKAIR